MKKFSANHFQTLDLLDFPVDRGRVLVEAAAGSGKTYTIKLLFLRLVLEREDLEAGNILVVTFTEAATAELKERIREVLSQAAGRLAELSAGDRRENPSETGDDIDRILRRRLGQGVSAGELGRRLRRARAAFDEVVIATIHGFCNRVLNDFAFEAGVRSRVELTRDADLFCRMVAEDYWRRFFYGPETVLTRMAAAGGITPENLTRLALELERRPELLILPETPRRDSFREDLEAAARALEKLEDAWQRGCEAAAGRLREKGFDYYRELLFAAGSLKKNIWKEEQFDSRIAELAELLENAAWPEKPEKSILDRFSRESLERCTRNRHAPPDDRLFELCQELRDLAAARVPLRERLEMLFKRDFLAFATGPEGFRRVKEQLRKRGYSDFLTELGAILEGRSGRVVRERVAERWRVALIDEFQDTDPVQYGIFSRLFDGPEQLFYRIGDPKQSIYAFRGADIFAYLAAARETGQLKLTLDRNYRSTPELLTAVNRVFALERPFLYDGIDYRPARSGGGETARLRIDGHQPAPLTFWTLDPGEGETLNKDEAVRRIAEEVASSCKKLLLRGELHDPQSGRSRPVRASDIAVLTRTNAEAARIMAACRRHGVPTALKSGSLWETEEAEELFCLLQAVLNPEDDRLLCRALATSLVGCAIPWLAEVAAALKQVRPGDGEPARELRRYEAWRLAFSRAREVWRRYGFLAMISGFPDFSLAGFDPVPDFELGLNLARSRRGERALTNFLHLQEVLHEAEREDLFSPRGLLNWFNRHLSGTSRDENEYELRLEEETAALQIMTVHKSKGLEFPVVFVPFLWSRGVSVGLPKEKNIAFHRREGEGYRHCLSLDPRPGEEILAAAAREELAEQLRFCYVALTRARSNLFLAWPELPSTAGTGLMYLRRPPAAGRELEIIAYGKRVRGKWANGPFFDAEGARRWEEIPEIRRCRRGFGIDAQAGREEACPGSGPEAGELPAVAPETGPARRFRRSLPPASGFLSFSRLAAAGPAPGAAGTGDSGFMLPDADPALIPGGPSPLAGISGGAAFGNAIHELFEKLDYTGFRTPLSGSGVRPDLEERIRPVLRRWGVLPENGDEAEMVVERVGEMLLRALNVPLPVAVEETFSLSRLRDGLAREMEFWLPLREGFRVEELVSWGERCLGSEWRLELPDDLPGRGFLNGFIDLVFTVGERFYLLDWKTNNLGPECRDYSPEALRRDMAVHHYRFQYYFYLLALHRYLGQRLESYRFERHFGGVFYLYVRGLNGRDASTGVFSHRPRREELEELERIVCA